MIQLANEFAKIGEAIQQSVKDNAREVQLTDAQLNAIADRVVDRLATRPRRVMTYAQLAEALQISESTLQRWKQAGKIPHVGVGDTVRFDFDAVVQALNRSQ